MAKIGTWSTTAASNNSASPDGFPEGMARSAINNAKREYKARIREWYENAEWQDFADVPTRTGATTFTVPTDRTSVYTVGRRIRCTDSSTLYGVIVDSVFSSVTTVTVRLDSGSLSASLTAVALGLNTLGYNNHTRTVAGNTNLTLGDLGGTIVVTSSGYVALPNVSGLGVVNPATINIVNNSGATLTVRTAGNTYADLAGRHTIPNNGVVKFYYKGDGKEWRRIENFQKTPAPTRGINAVKFNPSGDNTNYLQWQTTSTDPNKFLVSFWANAKNWNGRGFGLFGYSSSSNPRLTINSSVSGSNISLSCFALTTSGSSRGPVTASVGNFPSYETGWFHLLWAFDQTAGSEVSRLYIYSQATDSEDNAVVFPSNVGSSVGIGANFLIGDITSSGFSNYFDGDIAEVYIAIGQFLDISIAANREKFRVAGKPANLGADGSLPTGVAPTIYLNRPFDTFQSNSGTSLTSFNLIGSLSNATTYPSD